MSTVLALDHLMQDPRIWRGQNNPRSASASYNTGYQALNDALPNLGWPQTGLVEILLAQDGVGELSLLLPVLAQLSQSQKPIVLVAPPYRPYTPSWQAHGIALSQLHLVNANAKEAAWAMEQALRSGCCGAVIGWPMQADDKTLRRLQVAAETGNTLGFIFRPLRAADNPSPAPVRVSVQGGEQHAQLRLVKCRGANISNRVIAYFPAQASCE